MSKVMYLAMVTEVIDTRFTVECWGSTNKDNRHRGPFEKIHILKSSCPTTFKTFQNVYSTSWTWKIPFDIVKDTVLLRNVELLPTGFGNFATKKKLLKLLANLALDIFIS